MTSLLGSLVDEVRHTGTYRSGTVPVCTGTVDYPLPGVNRVKLNRQNRKISLGPASQTFHFCCCAPTRTRTGRLPVPVPGIMFSTGTVLVTRTVCEKKMMIMMILDSSSSKSKFELHGDDDEVIAMTISHSVLL